MGSGKLNFVVKTEAECGGVEMTITAGELGVDELQLEVFDEESGKGKGPECPGGPACPPTPTRLKKSVEFDGNL